MIKIFHINTILIAFVMSACITKKEIKSEEITLQTENKPTACILGYEELDTLSSWQSKFVNPEITNKGHVLLSAEISSLDNHYGILTYMQESDSLPVLLFVNKPEGADTSFNNLYKVLGVKKLNKLSSNQTFQSECSCKCDSTFNTVTGLISFHGDSTETIQAWTVDKKNGMLLKLTPGKVDCTDAFNTEYN